jgi:hypothetical protein
MIEKLRMCCIRISAGGAGGGHKLGIIAEMGGWRPWWARGAPAWRVGARFRAVFRRFALASHFVIPAKAGIQLYFVVPAKAGT